MKHDVTACRKSSARRGLRRWLLTAITCAGASMYVAAELVAVGSGGHSERQRPLVVTTIHPLALIVHELAGDIVDIAELLAPTQDPHYVSLKPSQRRLIGRADLVVWVGPTFESFMARPLASLPQERVLTWLESDSDDGRHSDDHHNSDNHHNSGGHPTHSASGGADPHIWLDLNASRKFGRRLVAHLGARYPDLALPLAQRLAHFEHRLDDSTAALTSRLQPLQRATFVAEHAAYGPFVDQFALQMAGSLSDSSGVAFGARNLRQLTDRDDIACVVVERPPGSKLARQLASGLGVPIVVIDPLGLEVGLEHGYSALLEAMARDFEHCLGP